MLVAIIAGLAGCTGTTDPVPGAQSTGDPRVVSHQGWDGIQFGDPRADLERDHGLAQQPGDCAARLPGSPEASPVFDERNRLVLVWVDPPLHTPAGLTVGSPVGAVREAHPDAEPLTPPAGTFQFSGLLATVDDRGYLFLHDGRQVQRLVVGYAEAARQVVEENYGTC
jgi:hypothetical protein